MNDSGSHSYDVRVWAIRKYKGKRSTTYSVRWTVGTKEWHKTFATARLAESHRAMLTSSSATGVAFDAATGLPASMSTERPGVSWLDHSVEFIVMKWPDAAPKYRKSIAESLTAILMAVLPTRAEKPSTEDLRAALYQWLLTKPHTTEDPPERLQPAIAWLNAHSPPVESLADASVLRDTLDRLSLKLDGRRASDATIARRRSALHNCLDFAVERKLLDTNPLEKLKRKRLPPTPAIDRRRVANSTQARALLASVHKRDPSLEAFFATMYFAGPRPAEVLALRRRDCTLPKQGWGRLVLSSSYQRTDERWNDDGNRSEERQLKHRAAEDTRTVPAHPELVKILQQHIETNELGSDGRLFVARTGRAGCPLTPPYTDVVSMNTIYRAWHRARAAVLTVDELESMLAKRPYDLRHACLSTWLNAGVPPTQVAEWAGHSVAVLLSVYAKCIDGEDEIAYRRIEKALEPDKS
ncbi:MAG: tyrosine-type recombinase/integrase [Kineosporiaceae bacterium]|nr:tyrosine-type recombinase/integrase [Aeromicrobium sp.]